MKLIEVPDSEKTKYMDLLLIADESVSMIEKYLYRGKMFTLTDEDLKALCVVTQEEPGVYEIKNIVTVPKYQGKGFGQQLISFIADYYKNTVKNYMLEQVIAPPSCTSTRSADS
jgi:GNAT superfamily N-acetyltransferase